MKPSSPFIAMLLSVAVLFINISMCYGNRIAILPMEDLSHGGNGANISTTHILEELLANKGFTVTPHEDVISFMVKNRVRWLGHLSTTYIHRLQEKLQVDYLLLGSIGQRRTSPAMVMNLHLQLIRTKDSRILWSGDAELTDSKDMSLLGLSKQISMEEMERQVAQKILATFPTNQAHTPPVASYLPIESVQLTPKITQPGQLIHCQIKLNSSPATFRKTNISIFIDNTIIDATYNEAENSFMASWPAEQINKHYMVTAAIETPQATTREIRVGQYYVDGTAPDITLQVKGQELDGIVILQKQIKILPTLKKPEPISRWHMTVHDENGNEVMSDRGSQGLPPLFSWWGQSQNGGLVSDGFYSIGLTVWDRAENSSSTKQSIRVIRTKPNMTLALAKQKDHLAINIDYNGEIPLAYWRLQIRNKAGAIIAERNGTESSGILVLPLDATASKGISYRLYAQDMLGNRLEREVDAVTLTAEEDSEEDKSNDDFLADLTGKQIAQGDVWTEDF